MSTIKEKINQDLKEAMKNQDAFKRDTLRMLNSAFKQVEVDQRISLNDQDVIRILKSAYKQREDAAQAYKKGGREDLFQKESKEMELILQYLPQQLSDEELMQALKQIIKDTQSSESKDMGKVMSIAKDLNADGKRIANMLKELLKNK